MNTLRRELLEKAFGGDVVYFKEQLLKALTISPDNCETLKSDVEELFADFQPLDVEEKRKVQTADDNLNTPEDKWADYRFRYVLLRQFRKYGNPDKSDGYYGLSLKSSEVGESSCQSAFLLGDNGAGKSSLFDAMEYACTKKISEAEYRSMSDLPWYYHHALENEPDIRLLMASKVYNLEDKKFLAESHLDVQRFFFSENSIYALSTYMGNSLESGNMDWVPFFCYLLGLNKVLAFLDAKYRMGAPMSLYDELVAKLTDIKALLDTDIDDEKAQLSVYLSNATIQLTPLARERMLEFQNLLKEMYEHWDTSENIPAKVDSLRNGIPRNITYIRSLNKFRNFIDKTWIAIQKENMEHSPLGPLAKKINSPDIKAETLKMQVMEMSEAIRIMLEVSENNTIPFDKISRKVNNYLRLEAFQNLSSKQSDSFSIDELLELLEKLKMGMLSSLPSILKEYLDDNFKNVIMGTLQEKFITKDEKFAFSFTDKGVVCSNYGIELAVNGIPVNKYFNTFRFRLFCLCMLAAVNFKTMQKNKMLFPFVFDDIFYANDYKNKAQLFKFFEVLAEAAEKMLGDKDKLQVIFFTHDEQFVSTLFRKQMPFKKVKIARLLDSRENVSVVRKIDATAYKYYPLCKEFKRRIQHGI